VYAGAFVAVAAILDTITSGFQPAYPFGMHKNGAGPLMAMGIVVLIAAPWRLEIRPSWVRHLRILLVLGVFATQSRGAGLALVAVIAFYAMRHREARQRAPVFFLVVSLALIVASAVTLQAEHDDNPKFNGIDTREGTYDVALGDIWSNHPVTGGGMRWFDQPGAAAGVPHNLVIAELSENGIIGLLAVLVLIANTVLVLLPRRDPMGEAALLVLVLEVLFGLTGIFWVAGTFTLPFLIVGLAVGDPSPVIGRSQRRALTSPSP
jgi:O-antigen ligase